jgi:microsomal dipeptidase-like Zn-dependent dipeptidase
MAPFFKGAETHLIEKMMDLGMIVDIVHCTLTARWQIVDIVHNRRPVMALYVGAYAFNSSPYNLPDQEAREIAASGGVIGVILIISGWSHTSGSGAWTLFSERWTISSTLRASRTLP